MSTADTALLFGYVLAVPFTLFIPGFLRLWRRREIEVFAVAEVGAAVTTLAWAAKGSVAVAVATGLWTIGLAIAWTLEGRKRTRTA